MQDKKPWYLSKTIWGIIIAAAGFALQKWGVVSPELPANADFDQIKGYVEAVKASGGGWQGIASVALQALGFIYALYGRVVADAKIG